METVRLKTQINNGKIQLGEISCNLPTGPAEVVVVVQSVAQDSGPPYLNLKGFLADQITEELDVDKELQEMNQAWKDSLDDL